MWVAIVVKAHDHKNESIPYIWDGHHMRKYCSSWEVGK